MRLRTLMVPVALLPLAIGACSSSPDGAAPAAPSTTSAAAAAEVNTSNMGTMDMGSMDMGSTDTAGKVVCAQHMPGDLLSAAEAMVIFDHEHVCLSYVTVRPGTPITWHNQDGTDQTVTIEDANGTEVTSFSVPAGGSAERKVDVAGVYRYKLTAIESFVGTIEVDAP